MSKFIHVLAHVGLLALQAANAAAPFVPPPYNVVVAAGLAAVQGTIAIINHKSPAAPVAK